MSVGGVSGAHRNYGNVNFEESQGTAKSSQQSATNISADLYQAQAANKAKKPSPIDFLNPMSSMGGGGGLEGLLGMLGMGGGGKGGGGPMGIISSVLGGILG